MGLAMHASHLRMAARERWTEETASARRNWRMLSGQRTWCTVQEIQGLESCHAGNPYAKFWGVCNDHKLALDRCFKAEVRFPPTARGPLASLSF